jgi:hypothetical protein
MRVVNKERSAGTKERERVQQEEKKKTKRVPEEKGRRRTGPREISE